MATPFTSLKIPIEHLNLSTLKTLLFMQKISHYLTHNLNLCNFALFLPKIGCSIVNSDSVLEYVDDETLLFTWTISRLFAQNRY